MTIELEKSGDNTQEVSAAIEEIGAHGRAFIVPYVS